MYILQESSLTAIIVSNYLWQAQKAKTICCVCLSVCVSFSICLFFSLCLCLSVHLSSRPVFSKYFFYYFIFAYTCPASTMYSSLVSWMKKTILTIACFALNYASDCSLIPYLKILMLCAVLKCKIINRKITPRCVDGTILKSIGSFFWHGKIRTSFLCYCCETSRMCFILYLFIYL